MHNLNRCAKGASTTQKKGTQKHTRSSNKEEGKTHKGKIPPAIEGAYKTIAKVVKNGMTRHVFGEPRPRIPEVGETR
jgi:hypothetical protein